MAKVKISRGLQANYNAIPVKDGDTIYVCTDSGNIYVGELPVFEPNAYIDASLEGKIITFTTHGADGTNGTDTLDLSVFQTASEVAQAIADAISSIPDYTIEKLASAETGYSSSYVLKRGGTQVGATINIPKDMVVSNGEVKTVTTANVPYQGAVVGDKYIDLTIANTSQNHIYIPVKDLVDVYVASNGIHITQSNEISVKIDTNHSNGLGVGGDGVSLYVVTPSVNGVGGTNGAMLATDKEKLDGIEAGAEENVIETVKVSGTALTVTDKSVNIETETAYDPATNKIATMSDVASATPNVGHLKTNNTTAQTPSASESFTGDINLHKIAKTGSYNDLLNRPNLGAYVPYTDTDYANIGTLAFNPKSRTFSGSGWYRIYRGSPTSVVHFLLNRNYNSPAPEGYDVDVEMSDSAEFTVTDDDWGVATITQNAGYFNSASAQEMSKIRVYGYSGGPSGNPNNGYLCIDIYIYDRTQYNNSYRVSGYLLSPSTNSVGNKFYAFSDLTADDIAYAEFCQGKNSTKYYLEFNLVNGFKTNKTAEATAFKKTGGTSSQFLKADGSVDSNTYATTSQLPSLPLSIANGGTGATTAKAAEYNILSASATNEITTEIVDTYRIPFLTTSPSTTNGIIWGYRTASKIWNYIKSKIASVLGIGGSNGVPTAPTAAAGTNTTQIATTAFVQSATNGMAIDTNVVHKTGDETIAGVKTFTDNVVLEDAPTQGTHATNKAYVDSADNSVFLNGATADYKIHPYSLCAFATWSGGTWMAMTSFTDIGGTGTKNPLPELRFPIGCKIYYYPESTEVGAVTSFYHKQFYTSYKNVDARYSAITGQNVSLGNSNLTSVYLHVDINGHCWFPYFKEGSTDELIISPNNFVSGNFYIYLGKKSTLTSNVYEFQLEDNNILYYFDGDDLIDWATYISSENSASVLPFGGTTGQVLAKHSNTDGDVEWINQSAGVTDYDDLDDQPQINSVTLSGNKTSSQLGLQSELTFDNTPTANSDNPVKSGGVKTALDAKQDTLVSGTNIKTVNNTSLLGSGNIQINDGVGFQTITTQQDGTMQITLTNGDTITVDLNHVHPQYYSKVREAVMPQGGFLPDVVYSLGVLSSNTTFSLASMVVGNTNHYYWTFSTATTAITVTWPTRLIWANGSAPTIAANKHYEISILDNFAVYMETSIQEND